MRVLFSIMQQVGDLCISILLVQSSFKNLLLSVRTYNLHIDTENLQFKVYDFFPNFSNINKFYCDLLQRLNYAFFVFLTMKINLGNI